MSDTLWRPEDVPTSCAGCRPGCPEVCECCPRNVSRSGPENCPGLPTIAPGGLDGEKVRTDTTTRGRVK